MIEPFDLTLKNINLTPDEWDEEKEKGTIIVGGVTAHVLGKLQPGAVICVEVDSDGDMAEINVINDGAVDGYIFRSEDILLPTSLQGNILVWNDRDYGSVIVVLKEPLPDMTFDEEPLPDMTFDE